MFKFYYSLNYFIIQYSHSGADPGFGQGGAQLLRLKVANAAKRSRVQGPLKGPGSFWVFAAQICILTHSRDFFLSFLISILTLKVDKNRALDFT